MTAIIAQNKAALIIFNANKIRLAMRAKTASKAKACKYLFSISYRNFKQPFFHPHKQNTISHFNLLMSVYITAYSYIVPLLIIRRKLQYIHPHV